MISHFGSDAVAAIGNGNQVMNVVIIVLTTMSTATTILLTQHIGAGHSGDICDEIATVGITVSAVFSLLVGRLSAGVAGVGFLSAAHAGGGLCRRLPLYPHRGRHGAAAGTVHRAVRHFAQLYAA